MAVGDGGRCGPNRLRFRQESNFGQPKVQDLGVPPFGDKDISGLNIAMNDTSGVRGVQRIRYLDGYLQ